MNEGEERRSGLIRLVLNVPQTLRHAGGAAGCPWQSQDCTGNVKPVSFKGREERGDFVCLFNVWRAFKNFTQFFFRSGSKVLLWKSK